jgi:hypothetical protein
MPAPRAPLVAPLLAVALAAGLPAMARADEKYVAVLELTGGADRSVMGALTDRIRTAAGDALRGRFRVISRDEVAERLLKNGRSCDLLEGACSVELGRMVGADLVLAGRALPVSSGLEVSLQLHDSVSGALVSSATMSAAGPLDALGKSSALTEQVLRKYLAPPPPLGAEASGNYLEVRALGRTLGSVKHAGTLHCEGPCRGNPAEVVFGYRSSLRWAWEVLALGTEYYRSGDPYALRGQRYLFGLGVDWAPQGSRWLSVAAGGGASYLSFTLRDPGATREPPRGGQAAPAVNTEVRLNLPLRTVQFGLRAGARVVLVQHGVDSTAGARRVLPGPAWEFPLTLSIRLL